MPDPHVVVGAMTDGSFVASRLPRIAHLGGPFVRRPRIVTITFTGDDPRIVSRVEEFGATIARASWWRTVVDGYCARQDDCVGDAQSAVAVRLDEALPAEVHAVEISALLRRHAGNGRFGRLDSELVLLVYLPRGVTLRDAFVTRYCDGPRAFHRALRLDSTTIAYAVIPRCGDEAVLTATASHELLEMTLNVDPARPGFAFRQEPLTHGFAAAGHEAMDPCGFITDETSVREGGFLVRRAWSNRAASAGHDPCAPRSGDRPFVALIPSQPAVRLLRDGETVTIGLQAAADRPIGRWSVSAVDLTGGQESARYVDVTLDKIDVSPGDAAMLRLTRRRAHRKHLSVVGIVSRVDSFSYLWPLAVVSR
jgi:hypothetical protein